MDGIAAQSNGDSNSRIPSCWTASTNWIVSHGSLQDSISFDSSSSISDDADDGVGITRDHLLLKPPSEDPIPCEVTICFRERYDIHRVYVRSTARVYEIYYAPEQQSRNNEYLCTVRCGAAAKEPMLPTSDSGEAVMECQKRSDETMEVSEQMMKSDNNNSSDEDGWVEVKVPDSPYLDDKTNSLSKKIEGNTNTVLQTYYEATAEISDASPCISVTLRLLSLQTKGCVFVEEIYIYADSVESTDSGTSVNLRENSAGSSLLAMLVPSLLQLSKTGSSRLSDRRVLEKFDWQNSVDATVEVTENINPEIGGTMPPEVGFSTTDPREGQMEAPREAKSVNIQLDSGRQAPGPDQIPKSVPEITNLACSRMEKVLDELVSRVGRIETFCSRFEENMLKPLSCIETRLQRMEQQLDVLTAGILSSESFPYSRFTAPDFSFNESDSDNNDCNISDVAREDGAFDNPLSPADDATATGLVSEMCPGLAIKAPEFPNEDEDVSCSGKSDSAGKSCPRQKASLSINSALASALEAFLSSASVKSPKCSPTLVNTPEYSNEGDYDDEFAEAPARIPCEGPDSSGLDSHVTYGEPIVDLDSVSRISSKDSEEQGKHHRKWFKDSSIEATVKEASIENQCHRGWVKDSCIDAVLNETSNDRTNKGQNDAEDVDCPAAVKEASIESQCHRGCVKDSCIDDVLNETFNGRSSKGKNEDSDAEDVDCQVLNLNPICNGWSEDSSSDSSIGENITLEKYSVNWTDESSTDSSRGSFTLCNWLYGQKDYQYHKDVGVKETVSCGSLTTNEDTSYNHDKSKVELERALNSTVDYELQILDVKFTPERTWQSGSPLETLLGEMPDSTIQVSSDEDDNNGIGHQNSSFSTLGEELHAGVVVQQFLVDLEDWQEGNVQQCPTASINGQSGSPLETLLGEMPDSTVQVSSDEDDNNGIGIGHQNSSYSTQGDELHAGVVVEQVLVDLEDCQTLLGEMPDSVIQVSSDEDDNNGIGHQNSPFSTQGEELHAGAVVEQFLVDLEDCQEGNVQQYPTASINGQPFSNLL